jgi:biopolymer transport protein ExbD
MFLNIIGNIAVVFAVIIFFLVAVIINGLTKTPDVELPEQCNNCQSSTCHIKFDKNPKPKETIQEYYKKCEENNAN